MKLKAIDTNILSGIFHGYLSTSHFFRGNLIREVPLAIYDETNRTSNPGYLYICDNVVLLYIRNNGHMEATIFELTKKDTLETVVNTDERLHDYFLSLHDSTLKSEIPKHQYFSFLVLNNDYVLLPDTLSGLTIGEVHSNKAILKKLKKSDLQKTQNLASMISEVLYNKEIPERKPLPGRSHIHVRFRFALQFFLSMILGTLFILIVYSLIVNSRL